MTEVFISYRSADSGGWPSHLDYLVSRTYGRGRVFRAAGSVKAGEAFPVRIARALLEASVVLAVIGPQWPGETQTGRRRLDDANDWVRTEIRLALTAGTPIVPVLVDGATRLTAELLPEDIRELATRHAIHLDSRSTPDDRDRLLNRLEELCPSLKRPPTSTPQPDRKKSVSYSGEERRTNSSWGSISTTGEAARHSSGATTFPVRLRRYRPRRERPGRERGVYPRIRMAAAGVVVAALLTSVVVFDDDIRGLFLGGDERPVESAPTHRPSITNGLPTSPSTPSPDATSREVSVLTSRPSPSPSPTPSPPRVPSAGTATPTTETVATPTDVQYAGLEEFELQSHGYIYVAPFESAPQLGSTDDDRARLVFNNNVVFGSYGPRVVEVPSEPQLEDCRNVDYSDTEAQSVREGTHFCFTWKDGGSGWRYGRLSKLDYEVFPDYSTRLEAEVALWDFVTDVEPRIG